MRVRSSLARQARVSARTLPQVPQHHTRHAALRRGHGRRSVAATLAGAMYRHGKSAVGDNAHPHATAWLAVGSWIGAHSPSCSVFDHCACSQAEQHPRRELTIPAHAARATPGLLCLHVPDLSLTTFFAIAPCFLVFQGGVFSQEITEIVGASCSGKTQVSFPDRVFRIGAVRTQ